MYFSSHGSQNSWALPIPAELCLLQGLIKHSESWPVHSAHILLGTSLPTVTSSLCAYSASQVSTGNPFYQKIASSHDLCLHLSSFSNTHVSNPSAPTLPPVPNPRCFIVFVMAAIGAASRSQVLYESAIAIVMLRNKQSPNSAAYSISVLSTGVREARAWRCSVGLSFRPRAALGLFRGSH